MISDLMSFLRIIDVFYMPRAEVCVIKSWLLIILTHQKYFTQQRVFSAGHAAVASSNKTQIDPRFRGHRSFIEK